MTIELAANKSKKIDLGIYLFTRIKQLGITSIFGVPGDFNLQLLDYVYKVPDLKWVGCCNELNAAYAADGFGRITGLPGILITTYGVGETSALNGIAGAYAEQSPILHIVGMTARPFQDKKVLIHHVIPSIGRGLPDHSAYIDMSEKIRVAHGLIWDEENAPDIIDDVIVKTWQQSRPGYIHIPIDMANAQVDASNLDTPLKLEIKNNDIKLEDEIVDSILNEIKCSKNPVILADTLAERHRAKDLVRKLVSITKFHSYTTLLGKGIIDETDPNYIGTYIGNLSLDGIVKDIEVDSDLVIDIGSLPSDSNTGAFSRSIPENKLISLHPHYVSIRDKYYDGVHFYPILKKIIDKLTVQVNSNDILSTLPIPSLPIPKVGQIPIVKSKADISHTFLHKVISDYLQPNDTILTETGTIQFALPDLKFKENTNSITQIFFSCIGFTLPATLGALVANHDFNLPGRVILIEGDGSAQMTIQELGTMVKLGLTPTIFLLNNEGYTIERAIWGPNQQYNDICPNWNWTELLKVFGGREEDIFSTTVKTEQELQDLCNDEEFKASKKIQLVEVILDVMDIPWRLSQAVEGGKKNMANTLKSYAEKRAQLKNK